MTVNPGILHAPDCSDYANTEVVVGQRGDTLHRCQTCSRFEIIERAPASFRPEPPAGAPEGATRSRWRCRQHLEEAVSWRGRGCASCANERLARSLAS